MTLLLLIIATMAAITSSGYIPPYYGHYSYGGHYGDRDHKHGLYDSHYGSYEDKGSDDEHDYYGDKYGHHYGYDGHSGSGYGDRRHLAGRSYYDKNGASGSKDESYEMGGKANSDATRMMLKCLQNSGQQVFCDGERTRYYLLRGAETSSQPHH